MRELITIGSLLDELDTIIDDMSPDAYRAYVSSMLGRTAASWAHNLDRDFVELAEESLILLTGDVPPDRTAARVAYRKWEGEHRRIVDLPNRRMAKLGLVFVTFFHELAGGAPQGSAGPLVPPIFDEQAWVELGPGMRRMDRNQVASESVEDTRMLIEEISRARGFLGP